MLLVLLASLEAHAGKALEATYTFLPEGTTLGGAERAVLGGMAFTGNSSGGRLTGHSELRALFGAGMPQQGFAWDSELLLGLRYWPAGAVGFGLDSGFGGSAIGDALPRAFRVPLEARLTLAPRRLVIEPYFRSDIILGSANPRKDGGTLIGFGDELRYGVDLSYIVGAGRLNTLTVGYRRTEQLGVVTNGVLLQIWLGQKQNDDDYDYSNDGDLSPEETQELLDALTKAMTPTSDAAVLTGDPFCDALNLAYADAPNNFVNIQGAERPPAAMLLGTQWDSSVAVPGQTEPATIYGALGGGPSAWVSTIASTHDAAEARAAHDAFVQKVNACSFPRIMVTDGQELENLRYNTWIPFAAEGDLYAGWILEVQTATLPDIETSPEGDIKMVDSYSVIFRVSHI